MTGRRIDGKVSRSISEGIDMAEEFADDNMVEDGPFDHEDPEDRPLYPPEDEADDPGETGVAGESEDVSTDATVQGPAETAKASKGRKSGEVKAAKKAVTPPKAPKKAGPAKKAAAKSIPREHPGSKDRVLAMRGAAILLRQIGDPTRAAVIDLLSDGPRNVTDICEALGGLSQPAVSHHLALLRHGRIISPTRDGKNNFYALEKIGVELAGIIRTLSASA
jgi:DNA-binding transcriptional ArsR family regulator